ncbi:MAG TPA: hypothetical protein VK636_19330 [Gemmatimonadaceae bacterium]|nr:hypothetical protein [Gemmatimonadaceae bacterium]
MRTSRRLATLTLGSWIAATACDPCLGTASCGEMSPHLVIDGQIVRSQDGRGVDDIRIDVLHAGGVGIGADSISVTTSAGGFWHIDTPATGTGDVILNVRVSTPALKHPYTVRDLRVQPVTRHGEAKVLDRWVANPYFPYYVDIFLRGTDKPVTSTNIVFHQTAGSPMIGPALANGTANTGTDPTFGRAQFFVYNAFATDTGDVVGDMAVELSPPYLTSIVRGVRISPTHLYRAPGIVSRYGAGPSLQYAAQIYDRATGKPLPNIPIEFHRVGGISIVGADLVTSTDGEGYLRFHAQPLESGNVIADITITPPRGAPETRRETIPTFDDDQGKLLANWTVGPYLPFYGVVRLGGKDLAGVPVRVRRTGGVSVSPADTVLLTNASGGVSFAPVPVMAGNVVFELTFTPPAPFPRFMVSNVILGAVQKDQTPQLVWAWEVAAPNGPPGTTVTVNR